MEVTVEDVRWDGVPVDPNVELSALMRRSKREGAPGSLPVTAAAGVSAPRFLGVVRAIAAGGYHHLRLGVGADSVQVDLAPSRATVASEVGLWLQAGQWRAMLQDGAGCRFARFAISDAASRLVELGSNEGAGHVELIAADGLAVDVVRALAQFDHGAGVHLGILTPAETDFPSACPERRPPGTLSVESFVKVLKRHLSEAELCFFARADPDVKGKVVVNFTIDEAGKVGESGVVSLRTTLLDPSVNACVLSVVREMTFPAPTGGRVEATHLFDYSK